MTLSGSEFNLSVSVNAGNLVGMGPVVTIPIPLTGSSASKENSYLIFYIRFFLISQDYSWPTSSSSLHAC